MIKGIDAQIMTNRAAEYSKDVSIQLRRDELSNEFANRLSKLETEQELHTITEMEQLRGKRINADDDSGRQAPEQEGQAKEKGRRGKQAPTPGLPSVGATEHRLLDIEV